LPDNLRGDLTPFSGVSKRASQNYAMINWKYHW